MTTYPDLILTPNYNQAPPRMEGTIIPTGGLIRIEFIACGSTGPWTLSRAAGSAASVPIYVGAPIPLFIDSGDGTNTFLDPTVSYTYSLQTPSATITLGPIQPTGELGIGPDTLTITMLRVLQAGFAALILPAGWVRPKVMHAMPVQGRPTLPLISFALETLRDMNVPLGQNVEGYTNSLVQNVYDIADRRYRVTVMAQSVDEREFYRDTVLGIFRSILGPLLEGLGQNVTHSYHSASNQTTGEKTIPGFYFADIALQFSGIFSVQVTVPSPGVFSSIGFAPATSS